MEFYDIVFGKQLTVEWQRRSTGGIDFYFTPTEGRYRAFPIIQVETAISWSEERGIPRETWPVYLTHDHREISLEDLQAQNRSLRDLLLPLASDPSAPAFLSEVSAYFLKDMIFCILPGES